MPTPLARITGRVLKRGQLVVTDEDLGLRIGDGATPGEQLPALVAGAIVRTPQQYGARGDGTGNDGAAIQAAIAALSARGGGTLRLPAGTYRTTQRITLASNVAIVGDDAATTTIRAAAGVTTAVLVGLSGAAVANVTVRGVTVDADYAGNAIALQGVQVTNGSAVTIERCRIRNTGLAGVLLTTCTACNVERNEIDRTGQAQASTGFGVLVAGGAGHRIAHNRFTRCNGMNIGGNSNAVECLATGNVCDMTGTPRTTVAGAGQQPSVTGTLTVASAAGFPPDGTLSIAGIVGTIPYTGIAGNTFTGCSGAAGTAIDGGVARNGYEGVGITDGCERWKITDNHIIDSGDNGISASANRSQVIGNFIDGCQFTGIALAGGVSSLVIGNIVRNPGLSMIGGAASYSGIRISDGSRSIVLGNRLYDDQGTPTMRSGIREIGNSTLMQYANNAISGVASVEIELVSGTSTNQRLTRTGQTNATLNGAGTVAIDAAAGVTRQITVNTNAAFTIGTPTNPTAGADLTLVFINGTAGALGAITWTAGTWKLAGAFTLPGAGARRSISFRYDGTSWVETSRNTADVA